MKIRKKKIHYGSFVVGKIGCESSSKTGLYAIPDLSKVTCLKCLKKHSK